MTQLVVPYDFVSLSKWIYSPDWSYQVSHDIPFEDSVSGRIDLTLKNDTPMCVGGYGGVNTGKKNKSGEVRWELTPDRRCIIPGSSIKGMLRNIIEIACFAKFSRFENKNHSFREIRSQCDYMTEYNSFSVVPGWLRFEKNGWVFRKCNVAKLYNKDINKQFNLPGDGIINWTESTGRNDSRNESGGKKAGSANVSSAKMRYEVAAKAGVELLNTAVKAEVEYHKAKNSGNNSINYRATISSENGTESGYIVCCNTRIVNGNKGREDPEVRSKDYSYYFYGNDENTAAEDISNDIVGKLTQSHDSELWNYLMEHQNKKLGIPVWSMRKNNETKQLGLCRMPRIMCNNSIADLVKRVNKSHLDEYLFDLPELLFGTIKNFKDSKINFSLKSRLGFSDFISEKQISENDFDHRKYILQGPKTSFKAAYLQNRDKKERSYHNDTSVISGWKRYKIQKNIAESSVGDINEAQISDVELLKKNNVFKGQILFHNLKKEELGALLWAINFMREEGCHHSLGHATPYGAGSIHFEDISLSFPSYSSENKDKDAYIKSFTDEMNSRYPAEFGHKWLDSVQITQLKDISREHNDYPGNSVYNELKEFSSITDADGLVVIGEDKVDFVVSDKENQTTVERAKFARDLLGLGSDSEFGDFSVKELEKLIRESEFSRNYNAEEQDFIKSCENLMKKVSEVDLGNNSAVSPEMKAGFKDLLHKASESLNGESISFEVVRGFFLEGLCDCRGSTNAASTFSDVCLTLSAKNKKDAQKKAENSKMKEMLNGIKNFKTNN